MSTDAESNSIAIHGEAVADVPVSDNKGGEQYAFAKVVVGPAPRMETVQIASGQSLSAEIVLKGTLVAIQMPAAWDAADISFMASLDDGATYGNLRDQFGVELIIPTAVSRVIYLDASTWLGVRRIKVRSGSSTTPVAQTAARTITFSTVA